MVETSRSCGLQTAVVDWWAVWRPPLLGKKSHFDGEGVALAIGNAKDEVGDAPGEFPGEPDAEGDAVGVGLGVGVGVGLGNGGIIFSQ
jgi:hypothetical protein